MSTSKVYEVTNSATVGGVKCINVMHFMFPGTGDPTTANVNAMLLVIKNSFYTLLSSYMPTGSNWYAGSKVMVFDKDTPSTKTFVPSSGSIDFSASGTVTVTQLCACINWHTATPGRRSTGRTFVGPLNSAAITGQFLSSGAQTAIASAAANLPAAAAALSPSWWFGVYSKEAREFFPILSGTSDAFVDTLRSRKR